MYGFLNVYFRAFQTHQNPPTLAWISISSCLTCYSSFLTNWSSCCCLVPTKARVIISKSRFSACSPRILTLLSLASSTSSLGHPPWDSEVRQDLYSCSSLCLESLSSLLLVSSYLGFGWSVTAQVHFPWHLSPHRVRLGLLKTCSPIKRPELFII